MRLARHAQPALLMTTEKTRWWPSVVFGTVPALLEVAQHIWGAYALRVRPAQTVSTMTTSPQIVRKNNHKDSLWHFSDTSEFLWLCRSFVRALRADSGIQHQSCVVAAPVGFEMRARLSDPRAGPPFYPVVAERLQEVRDRR